MKRQNRRCLRSSRTRSTSSYPRIVASRDSTPGWRRMAMRDAPKKKDACCCRRFKPSQSIRFEVDPITFANGTPFSLSLFSRRRAADTSITIVLRVSGGGQRLANGHEIYISAKHSSRSKVIWMHVLLKINFILLTYFKYLNLRKEMEIYSLFFKYK